LSEHEHAQHSSHQQVGDGPGCFWVVVRVWGRWRCAVQPGAIPVTAQQQPHTCSGIRLHCSHRCVSTSGFCCILQIAMNIFAKMQLKP
jgi:hypothetical protein